MKKIKIILMLCSLLLTSAQAFAHPPSDIQIEFDNNTKTLKAVVYHSVANPLTHYIKKVDISLNGQKVQTLNFTRQMQKTTQPVETMVPEAKAGDVLSVEAYCNLYGKLKKEIKIS